MYDTARADADADGEDKEVEVRLELELDDKLALAGPRLAFDWLGDEDGEDQEDEDVGAVV
jgi:hypothetical protein